jgi:ubiquinone/menaquinone biosynthesis C-methylase UbiE
MSTDYRSHPLFARFYARISPAMDRGGLAEHRARLLDGVAGAVVEVGCGNGRNFPHYPAAVTRVLALEPDPHLRGIAERAATHAPVPIEVVAGTAERIPAEDGSFDAAVASLVLCSIGDPQAALREIHRVLLPGGQLRFLEHVQARSPGLRRVQRALDTTLWPRLAGGCHTGRDTETAIRNNGFSIELIERFDFPPGRIPQPATPHIQGTATRM